MFILYLLRTLFPYEESGLPECVGSIKDSIYEIKDVMAGQYIFVMKVFQYNSYIRIQIIVIAGIFKPILK